MGGASVPWSPATIRVIAVVSVRRLGGEVNEPALPERWAVTNAGSSFRHNTTTAKASAKTMADRVKKTALGFSEK